MYCMYIFLPWRFCYCNKLQKNNNLNFWMNFFGFRSTPCGTQSAWLSCGSVLDIASSAPLPTLASRSRTPLQFWQVLFLLKLIFLPKDSRWLLPCIFINELGYASQQCGWFFTYCGKWMLWSNFSEHFFPIWPGKMCPYLQENEVNWPIISWLQQQMNNIKPFSLLLQCFQLDFPPSVDWRAKQCGIKEQWFRQCKTVCLKFILVFQIGCQHHAWHGWELGPW